MQEKLVNFNFNFNISKSNFIKQKFAQFIWKAKKVVNSMVNSDQQKNIIKFNFERQYNKEITKLQKFKYANAKIKVFGIGNAGNKVLATFLQTKKIFNKNINYVAVNTDIQPLNSIKIINKNYSTLLLGSNGLGSGGDKNLVVKLVEKKENEIIKMMQEMNLIVLVSAIGKGTGSGATPALAKIAKKLNIPVVSLVFYPNTKLASQTKINEYEDVLNKIKYESNSYVVFNNNFFHNYNLTQQESFQAANKELINGLESIINLSGHLYDQIDSSDFIQFLKEKKQFCFYSMVISSNSVHDLNNKLNATLKTYQIKKNNINKFIIFSDFGKMRCTNDLVYQIANELKTFLGHNGSENQEDFSFACYNDDARKDIRINIIMSEAQKNLTKINNSIYQTAPLLTNENVKSARKVELTDFNKIQPANLEAKVKPPPSYNQRREITLNSSTKSNHTDDFILKSITKMFPQTNTQSYLNNKKN